MAKVTIYHGCDTVTLESKQEERTLLETLENNGLKPISQCKDGFCGACRVPLFAGKVSYLKEPIAYIGMNEALPCCCKPDGDIEIEI
ncbi:class I ribonucleotide reductase maintenance protein YfaE [Vibrio owensii]|uniref:class I ribonucleotide reductase maintenance protein YfaE n=1 Tax=Vibrio harveyi group TaxID=717610 RepID=UPI003CC5964B